MPRRSPTAPRSCSYIRETARRYGIDRKIRFRHRVQARRGLPPMPVDGRGRDAARRRAGSLHLQFPVHAAPAITTMTTATRPTWPAWKNSRAGSCIRSNGPKTSTSGKRVVVIGSGATAVTLVPALAETAAHVTMLQRSPTYIVARPTKDQIATVLRRYLPRERRMPSRAGITCCSGMYFYNLSRRNPRAVKKRIVGQVRAAARPGIRRAHAFHTRATIRGISGYAWRPMPICSARSNPARPRVVTDTIENFTETGIRLESGRRACCRHHRHRDRAEAPAASAASTSPSTASR